MRYYVKRGDKEYGPYSIVDLRKYLHEGSIQAADIARPENATQTTVVSAILEAAGVSVPAPAPPRGQPVSYSPPGQARTSGDAQYSAPGQAPAGAGTSAWPVPPDLHWGLVLLLTLITCGFFALVWVFVQAAFVKKLDRSSNAIILLVLYFVGSFVAGAFQGAGIAILEGSNDELGLAIAAIGYLITIGALVLYFIAIFGMRSSLHRHYTEVEPYGLRLGPVMTFFFAIFYFQYHFSRIAQWKRTGVKPL